MLVCTSGRRLKHGNRRYPVIYLYMYIYPLRHTTLGAPSSSRSVTSILPSCSSSNKMEYTRSFSAPLWVMMSCTGTLPPAVDR